MGIALAVDGVVTVGEKLVLVKRKNWPFKGCYALPGGFVEYGERVEEAVKREVREETGLDVEIKKLLGVYSDPGRDPRGHMVSIAYWLEAKGGKLSAGDDATSASMFPLDDLPTLAFDHETILADFKKMAKDP
jgi:8-oxo-dGTP diphosphatase